MSTKIDQCRRKSFWKLKTISDKFSRKPNLNVDSQQEGNDGSSKECKHVDRKQDLTRFLSPSLSKAFNYPRYGNCSESHFDANIKFFPSASSAFDFRSA
jgi:hypothetical protein